MKTSTRIGLGLAALEVILVRKCDIFIHLIHLYKTFVIYKDIHCVYQFSAAYFNWRQLQVWKFDFLKQFTKGLVVS